MEAPFLPPPSILVAWGIYGLGYSSHFTKPPHQAETPRFLSEEESVLLGEGLTLHCVRPPLWLSAPIQYCSLKETDEVFTLRSPNKKIVIFLGILKHILL